MGRLARYFFQGLIVLVPVAVTAYVLWAVFAGLDSWVQLSIPGLGVVLVLVGVTGIGFLSSLVLTAPLIRLLEGTLERLPFVKLLYGSVKDLLSAVVGEEKRFDRPVLVRVGDGVEVLGFVIRDSLDSLGVSGRAAVYVPQSYNFAGQTLIVPADRLTPLAVSGADAMTFAVSAAVAGAQRAADAGAPATPGRGRPE
jgi:uncharacterized membrane protein